jgi:leucyl-tRNA synthetase
VQYDGLAKMSKSRNNGVDPQQLVQRFGADAVRLFVMFTAPPEQTLEWSDEGVQGAQRFIRRLWTAVHQHVQAGAAPALDVETLDAGQKAVRRAVHQTLAKVTDDIGRRRTFNTAIAAVMELLNTVGRLDDASPQGRAVRQEAFSIVAMVLSPIVPHVCHALWQALGHAGALLDQPWPTPDAAAQVQDQIEISVQVNGKMRARVSIAAAAAEATVRDIVLKDARVQKFVGTTAPRKVIYVPGKLVSIVV